MPQSWKVIAGVAALLVAVLSIVLLGYTFLKGQEQAIEKETSGTYQLKELPKNDLVLWADNREFLGDSFDLRLPMWKSTFLNFLVILNSNNPDINKKHPLDIENPTELAIEQGILPANTPLPTDDPISAIEAYQLVQSALGKYEMSIEPEELAGWSKREYSSNDRKALNWDEALNLLYNMTQYRKSDIHESQKL